uniref:YaiI/YqxD family protein n=1 Tax=Permianibacter fluminis TaxID=2738515 RepID=UPI0015528012|nr:YaiI/YqxD family protein [Permianibacter fluminis]
MTLWVDADACPKVIKEIIFRVSARLQLPVVMVANQYLAKPASSLIRCVQVEQGFDVADNYIVQQAQPGDLVVTQDIPLAAELVEKKVAALNPRGELYTRENVRQRLNIRDFMDTMRASGEHGGGPAPFSQQDRMRFANALDSWLARRR